MAMMGFSCQIDGVEEQKMNRAATRHRDIYIKRAEYKAHLENAAYREQMAVRGWKPRTAPPSREHVNLHGAARSAARTRIAKGQMQGCTDMPATAMGRPGVWKRWLRKPSVLPLIGGQAEQDVQQSTESIKCNSKVVIGPGQAEAIRIADELAYEEYIHDFSCEKAGKKVTEEEVSDDAATTCPNSPCSDISEPTAEDGQEEESLLLPPSAQDVELNEVAAALDDKPLTAGGDEIPQDVQSNTVALANTTHSDSSTMTREIVMKKVVEAQRARIQQAEQEAQKAAAQAAAALKAKAEAEARIQEEAQERARCIAELKAQQNAEVLVRKEASVALKHAKELEQQCSKQRRRQEAQDRKMERERQHELEAARAEAAAEMKDLCAKALQDANAAKAKAEKEARSQQAAKNEAQAAKVAAEMELAKIRTQAQEELTSLRAKVKIAKQNLAEMTTQSSAEAEAPLDVEAEAAADVEEWEVLSEKPSGTVSERHISFSDASFLWNFVE